MKTSAMMRCPKCSETSELDNIHLLDHSFKREWVGLTDEVITQVIDSMPKKMKGFMVDWDLYEFSKAYEAKLKEKNNA